MIDYSQSAFPKAKPKALEKRAKALARDTQDRAETAKARKRAKGRCEVRQMMADSIVPYRCTQKDVETHHLVGGIGRRNKGKSILADYKLRVCATCHREITQHLLQPTTAQHDARTVRYRRVR